MLTLRYFPKSWKTAVVVPILKPGKNSASAESYRPISLLPVLSKLAEKVILARLNDHLEREKILISEQHGFRPRLSTSHQLLRVVEFIKEGNNKDECTAAVFLDIQKAFDRVWHTGLLFKLITYKIPPPLIFLLKSYISDRSFTVKINRTYSQFKKINAGVAQGSILAPTLFNLYVNDIIKNTNTQICLYADDTAILSRQRNLNTLVENINEHLAHLEIWFSVWKIAINSSKTKAVFFSKRQPPEITQQNQRIPWSQHTKRLETDGSRHSSQFFNDLENDLGILVQVRNDDHAQASSTTLRIIMSDTSEQMEFLPTKFAQVAGCEKLRDTVTADVTCTPIGPPPLKSRPPLQAQVSNITKIRVPDRGLKAAAAA
ncbi:RNA-directed DNA polymerase from mobile element jockey [Trichonephila clavipes]|nr:RNA-directed DNA polymerase from mobile element jockey [Trichonephila clavipes]